MNPPENMTAIIERKRYSTKTAELLSGNDHWDGHNYERSGTNEFLYRTPNDSYFAVHLTQWQGQRDSIEPLTVDQAIEMFERHSEQRVDYDDAFPGVEVQDA